MKKTMILSVALACASSVVWGAVETAKPMSEAVALQRGKLVKVFYQNEKPCEVKITIADDQGQVIYSEKIKGKSKFVRPYNFSQLDEGMYQVTIDDETGEQVKQVAYHEPQEDDLLVHITDLTEAQEKNKRYLLAVPNQGEEELTISILDTENHLLHQEIRHVTGDYAGLYRVINQPNGVIFRIVTSEGKEKTVAY